MQFSSRDAAWINSNPIIFGSKELGSGAAGRVYELDNNPSLVVKVPRRFLPQSYLDEKYTGLDKRTAITRPFIRKEIEIYNNVKNLEIIVPTVAVNLGVKTASGEDYIGLVRPKLDTSFKTLSDEQILDLRDMLIELSQACYRVRGPLQIGINNVGRCQIYDMGFESLRYCADKEVISYYNNFYFSNFLRIFRKKLYNYGEIQFS